MTCADGATCVNGVCRQGGCDATNCATGCCDAQGVCRPGRSNASCGTNGVACFACGPGLDCVEGVCRCTPGACPSGCCDEAGVCRSPSLPTKPSRDACGTNGEACFACGLGLDCLSGRCQCFPTSACAGCCNATGDACLDGSFNDLACGAGGVSCVNCTGQRKSCVNGVCVCTTASCPTVCCGGECCGPGQQCSGGAVPFCFS
jgi:hypothetical protein